MSKIKKALMICTCCMLVAVLAIGGTLAYLTSEDSDVNVMTLGNVKIEQNEQQRVEANGEFTNVLEDFVQGKNMMPYTSRTGTADLVNIGGYDVSLSDLYNNYIDKIVTVTNTGRSDAYVRTLIALPTGGWGNTYEIPAADAWLHWNLTKGVNNDTSLTYWNDGGASYVFTIDGVEYEVYEFIHKEALPAGETTFPILRGCYIDKRVGNDDQGYFIDYGADGIKRIDNFLDENDQLNILVLSQAVQADGFSDAEAALNEAFGDVTSDNAAKWFGGVWEEYNSVAFAVYCAEDGSLTFDRAITVPAVGDTYNGKTVSAVFTDIETTNYRTEGGNDPAWVGSKYVKSIKSVDFEDTISPISTASWFANMSNLNEITNLELLDTSNVTNMENMFQESRLTSLDLSSFDTSNVTNMSGMFMSCINIESLTLPENFVTAKVERVDKMFYACGYKSNFTYDCSNWDVSGVKHEETAMGCSGCALFNAWVSEKVTAPVFECTVE